MPPAGRGWAPAGAGAAAAGRGADPIDPIVAAAAVARQIVLKRDISVPREAPVREADLLGGAL